MDEEPMEVDAAQTGVSVNSGNRTETHGVATGLRGQAVAPTTTGTEMSQHLGAKKRTQAVL